MVPTDGIPVHRRSARVPQLPDRYGFLDLTGQLNNNPRTYTEVRLDINLDKWLEAVRFEMASMGSNKVSTLVDLPKGVKFIGCKWVYRRKLRADVEVTIFKARLMAKGIWVMLPTSLASRSRRMLELTPSSYIDKVFKRFKMENSKRGFLPMRPDVAFALSITSRYQGYVEEATTMDFTTKVEYITTSGAAKEAV
ncbi:hypothetical protein Sango_1580700 [Sesamum angolense]|uniref:Reverse transcriptase Ty1/copia-type domain-containing protein n=1 Tax=Sesamum angolense TaxID=2727404 RepID=A0AAE1WQ67_9LAMI|nr:hypothetical protein Sango_1580700 [Sesamum angolense]